MYKIIISHSANDLTNQINELVKQHWEPVGSHKVVIKHQQNRFRGQQHVDTLNELEYSQTMVLNKKKLRNQKLIANTKKMIDEKHN